jgi:endonuclease/exonuclease/phosphatase family metal-dependent hydrolase
VWSTGRDTRGVTRRSLLRSGLGDVVVGAFERGEAASVLPADAGRAGAPSGADQPDDGLSVRAAAEWTDHGHMPERVRGNGPPFADRPDLSGETLSKYDGKETLHEPDLLSRGAYDVGMMNRTEGSGAVPPMSRKGLVECHRWTEDDDWWSLRSTLQRHEEGVRVRCLWLNAALYGGEENLFDRARPIGRAIGRGEYDVVALCEIRDDDLADDLVAGYEAADRRIIKDTRGPREEKVVSKVVTKYRRAKDNVESAGEAIRTVAKHVRAVLKGEEPVKEASQNVEEETIERLEGRLAEVTNASGLVTLVGRDDAEPPSVNVADREKYTFERRRLANWKESPQAPFKIFTRGYQRHTIDIGDSDDPLGFDLFSTHLEGNQQRPTQRKKVEQLKRLTERVERAQGRREGIPKVVGGDFNFASDGGGYGHGIQDFGTLVTRFADIDHYDAWVTHGGPTGDTHGTDIPRELNDDGPYPGGNDRPRRTCHCEEFDHGSYLKEQRDDETEKATRLDYVFVEEPKSRHDVTIDLARMWRVPMTNECPWINGPPVKSKYDHRLTDHVGIGFELLIAPK